MLKLTFSPASPYVRKVLLSAYRAGIQDDIELVDVGTESDNLLRSKNPLGKIPVLPNRFCRFPLKRQAHLPPAWLRRCLGDYAACRSPCKAS